MWNRKDVKAKGKSSFKKNYWKCFLAAIILAIVVGGSTHFSGGGAGGAGLLKHDVDPVPVNYHVNIAGDIDDDLKDELKDNLKDIGKDIRDSFNQDSESLMDDIEDFKNTIDNIGEEAKKDANKGFNFEVNLDKEDVVGASVAIAVVMAIVFFIVMVIVTVISFLLRAFLLNPIELGCKRFFRKNLDEPASLGNVMFAFDSHYKNIAKTMFLRDLFTFLWSLLFVIPGIIKSYEYKLIPYLLSENPQMTKAEAFAESKRLMKGNKWRAFVLDLSFILWDLASLATCGMLGLFYVGPYKASTEAALYEAIKYGTAA